MLTDLTACVKMFAKGVIKITFDLINKDREITVLDKASSTNDYAKGLLKEGKGEAVIIAKEQTMGRGRMGRSFFSPKGTGIYMSVILKPREGTDSLSVTAMAGVAVCRAIDKLYGAETKIKWVNDIYLSGKKICGILAEGIIDPESQKLSNIILGIGINVHKTKFPKELKEIATAIENEIRKEISRSVIIAEILNELDRLLYSGEFIEEYKQRSMVLGKEIRVIKGNEGYLARAVDFTPHGGLVILADGEKRTLTSGEISIRFPQR